jgi:hypothetical protein
LRGTQGARFEGTGKISRGPVGLLDGCCFCRCFTEKESGKERWLLIKGPFCFVFATKDDPAPKYAIGLQSMQADLKGGASTVVISETDLGDVEYEFTFQDVDIAKQFKAAIDIEVASAQVDAVRKRLGHEHLISKRSSLIFAETVAKEKIAEQPDAPIMNNKEIAPILPPM